jgi:hypothetical protein
MWAIIWKQIAQGAQSSVSGLYSLHTAVGNGVMEKFGICFQLRNEQFMPRMLSFSIGDGAINAPRSWQWRKGYLTHITRAQQCLSRLYQL